MSFLKISTKKIITAQQSIEEENNLTDTEVSLKTILLILSGNNKMFNICVFSVFSGSYQMKAEVVLINRIILHDLSVISGIWRACRASIIPYMGTVRFSYSGWIPHVCFGTLCRKTCRRLQFQLISTFYHQTCQLDEMTTSCIPCNIREECIGEVQKFPPQRACFNFYFLLFCHMPTLNLL